MKSIILAAIIGCSSTDKDDTGQIEVNTTTDTGGDETESHEDSGGQDTGSIEDTNTERNIPDYNENLSIQENLDAGISITEILQHHDVEELYGLFYRGGFIFYVDTVSGAGMVAHTLETNEAVHWCDFVDQDACINIGSLPANIGSGGSNTAKITTALGDGTYAAKHAEDASINGFDDWHLPSLDELTAVYQNLRLSDLGNVDPNLSYWSSTDDSTYAWVIYFVNGNTYTPSKYHPHHNVLPVRSFSP